MTAQKRHNVGLNRKEKMSFPEHASKALHTISQELAWGNPAAGWIKKPMHTITPKIF